jgi:hypothetical protein
MKTYNVLKYGDSEDPYCSTECQENHFKDLQESEFLSKKNIKYRDYALVIDGSEDSLQNRPKEGKKYLITGNKTEQRVDLLREKVYSMSFRLVKLEDCTIKARFLYPIEIQNFFLGEVPKKLQVSDTWIQVAASQLRNKCVKVYPTEFCLEDIDEKTSILTSIK